MVKRITLSTRAKTEVINVTDQLAVMVKGVANGIALFYTPHTTAALLMCEDDEELRRDLVRVAEQWLMGLRPFAHIRNNNPNAEAHIFSAFGGTSLAIALENGRLDLGKYQNILLLELDGPKEREIRCQVVGA
jgi:secondary thiamine-phosphate synthase enzyme